MNLREDGHSPPDVAPLRILASAMAGRAVDVVPAEPGDRTWTDGTTVFLETDATPSEQMQLLGVQASLLAASSLDPDVVAELGRSRRLAQRYLAVEAHRALAANESSLPPDVRRLIRHDRARVLGSTADSLTAARAKGAPEPDWVHGTIEPRRVRQVAATEARADLLATSHRAPSGDHVDIASLEELDEDPEGFDVGNLFTSPVGGGGRIGRLLARLVRPSRRRGGGGAPGADAPTHFSTSNPGGGRTVVTRATQAEVEPTEAHATTSPTYPEWDARSNRYRVDWCTVIETDAPEGESPPAPAPETRAMRRALAPLGLGLVPCRRQRQGDDIDIDAVVEARVDLAAGSPHDDDLYIESLRHRRDLAVLILLDVSGSAAEPGVGGRTVHEHQREAAAVLTGALHQLGDRVSLYAFSSRGRRSVQVAAVKRFDEALDGRAIRRLHGLAPGAYTRVGAAIRHGTAVLDRNGGTSHRLLVVVSDGFAYDHGYEGRYGEADARRALLEARRAGVGCLCLSIGADASSTALRRVFGSAAHASVPTADRLPALVGPLFASALSSAEAQRRRFQRTERSRERLLIDQGVTR